MTASVQGPAPGRAFSTADRIAVIGVGGVAAALRFTRLDLPKRFVFDEVYYAKDACYYLAPLTRRVCGEANASETHPPLAKWLIAAGIRAFGFDSFGWRVAAAVAGSVTVVLLYLLALRLLRSTAGAAIAAGLLAVDPLHFVQSRLAMVDVFVPAFGVGAFLLAVRDRDDGRGGVKRPWLAAAGACAGAAVASKWAGATVVAALFVVVVAWGAARRRRGGERSRARAALAEVPVAALYIVAVPLVVYALSYAGRVHGDAWAVPWEQGSWAGAWWDAQRSMLDYHIDLDATHSYQSPAWSWLLLKRPVAYFFCSGADCRPPLADGHYQEIAAIGNPFAWWLSALAFAFVTIRWLLRRDPGGAAAVIVVGFAFTYGSWLVLDLVSPRDATFLFYMLPALPFLYLAAGHAATQLGTAWEARAAVALFCAGAVAAFAFYYPVVAGTPIARDEWDRRMHNPLVDDCAGPGSTRTSHVVETRNGVTITRTRTSDEGAGGPPPGWCWV